MPVVFATCRYKRKNWEVRRIDIDPINDVPPPHNPSMIKLLDIAGKTAPSKGWFWNRKTEDFQATPPDPVAWGEYKRSFYNEDLTSAFLPAEFKLAKAIFRNPVGAKQKKIAELFDRLTTPNRRVLISVGDNNYPTAMQWLVDEGVITADRRDEFLLGIRPNMGREE